MSNLYVYLIRSRYKDNKTVKGFRPRSKSILEYEENEQHILEEFEDFAKKGLPGEKTRLYKSVNSRNEDKTRHGLLVRILRDGTKLPTLNNTLVSTALRAECRDESKWLFDFDIDDENAVSAFVKDIPVRTDITKTPHGYAVVCEHKFDTRPLHEKWQTQIDNGDITLKRDDLLFMNIRTSDRKESNKSMDNKEFNAKAAKESIIKWIREWMDQNGKDCSVVIGISGGKDSTITAALCVEALGKDRVFGVLMPNGRQKDIGDAICVVRYLGIRSSIVNIKKSYDAVLDTIQTGMVDNPVEISDALKQNLPPRIRMATLYAIAQGLPEGGRVVNTCNLSEDWVGYSTKYGDSAGDFSPLGNYTVTEILQIGNLCDIPKVLICKAPSDGLCGKTDEENLGFTYAVLDHYIRTGECEDPVIKELIDKKHRINLHKLELLPKAPNKSPIVA